MNVFPSPFRSWGSGLRWFKHGWLRIPLWFCCAQCNIRGRCLSRRKQQLPSPRPDHPGYHQVWDEPTRCWITVTELGFILSLAPSGASLCRDWCVGHSHGVGSATISGPSCAFWWSSSHIMPDSRREPCNWNRIFLSYFNLSWEIIYENNLLQNYLSLIVRFQCNLITTFVYIFIVLCLLNECCSCSNKIIGNTKQICRMMRR